MTAEQPSLASLRDSYKALVNCMSGGGAMPLDTDTHFEKVTKRILQAVSTEIGATTSEIKSIAAEGLTQSSQVAAEVKALPEVITKDINTVPERIKIEEFNFISSSVRELLSSFQQVVQNPSVIFPRLPCGEIPVNPALISSFKRRYLKLEQSHRTDSELQDGERSMPTAPKSALDVITNITSSLDSYGDDVLASIEGLKRIYGELGKLRDLVQGLKQAADPITEMVEEQEAIHNMISRVASLFDMGNDPTTRNSGALKFNTTSNPMDLVEGASSILKQMNTKSEEIQVTMTKWQSASTLFSSLIRDMKEFFSVLVEAFSRLLEALQKLRMNLPRIARELRQFFMPAGIKAIFLRPSSTLVTILQSMEDIKASLSDPESLIHSAINDVRGGDTDRKVEAVKNMCGGLGILPEKLVSAVQSHDLQNIITDTIRKVLLDLMNETGASAIQGAVTNMLEVVGNENLATHVSEGLDFLMQMHNGEKPLPSGSDPKPDSGVSLAWGADKLFR